MDKDSWIPGTICSVEGIGQGQGWEMQGVGREYITKSQHAMPEFKLCAADSGSCRNGSEAINFCVLETSPW